ncbi:MAG TPA: metallophosphoesterase, partial [Synergistales bacterium]|nr:metallophosphoesterase [Synergistales bacterium]
MSIILLSSLLFTASNCSAGTIPEHNSAVTLSGYSFTLDEGGIPGLSDERSIIVVISDIHLGMDDRYAEIQKNRAPLIDFLQKLRRAPNIKELVIAGDLVDEWFIPAGVDTYDGKSQKEFVQAVAANNKEVVDAFNDIIRDGKIKTVYVPGNHDLLVTSESIQT